MTLAAKVSDRLGAEILSDLCARNHPAQLVYETAKERTIESRVRFLKLAGDKLLIDVPTVSGRPFLIRPGERIQLYFLWKRQRLAVSSVVVGQHKLREPHSPPVDALAIRYPREVQRAQRRECFRLSLVHLKDRLAEITFQRADDLEPTVDGDDCEALSAEITPVEASEAGERPAKLAETRPARDVLASLDALDALDMLEASSASSLDDGAGRDAPTEGAEDEQAAAWDGLYRGRMLNISETGIGVVFERKNTPPVDELDMYRLSFQLPGEEPFRILAQVRWNMPHPAGDRVMLGLAWQLDPTVARDRETQRRLGRFIHAEQQELLRRSR